MRLQQWLHPENKADAVNRFVLTGDHWSIAYQGQTFTAAKNPPVASRAGL